MVCFQRFALLRTTLFLWIVSPCSGRYSDSLQAAIDFSAEKFNLHCFKCIVFFKSLTSAAAHYLLLVLQAVDWRGWKTSCYPVEKVYHTTTVPLQMLCYEVVPFSNAKGLTKTQIACSNWYWVWKMLKISGSWKLNLSIFNL